MQPGHQVKPVTRAIAIGFFTPEAHDLMDQALEEWGKHRAELIKTFPDLPNDEVYSFAYWLFRWSGLIEYDIDGDNQ